MQIPDEFYDLCLYLHQDSFYVYGTDPKDIAAGAIRHMSKAQKETLGAFLDVLLTATIRMTRCRKSTAGAIPKSVFAARNYGTSSGWSAPRSIATPKRFSI